MREVIRGVMEAEAAAKRLVENARHEAEQRTEEAQRRAQEVLIQVRAETRVEADKMVEAAVRQAHAEKARALEAAAADIATVHLDAGLRDQIVDAVVRSLCGSV